MSRYWIVAVSTMLALVSGAYAQGTIPVMSSSYNDGVTARIGWEQWVGSLNGSFSDGARYWAAARSTKKPTPCETMTYDRLFLEGCTQARERLKSIDLKRRIDPDYRAGFNNYTVTASPDQSLQSGGSGTAPVLSQSDAGRIPSEAKTELPNAPNSAPQQSSSAKSPIEPFKPNIDQALNWVVSAGVVMIIFLVVLYFLPTLIANKRKMDGLAILFLVNLFLGWTMIGWLVVLLWSALGQTRAQRRFYEQAGNRI